MTTTEIKAPTDEEMVLGALQSLGTTPDEVADTLRELGVTGDWRQADRCPISNFVRGLNKRYTEVSSYSTVFIVDPDERIDPETRDLNFTVQVEAPEPVYGFIINFDEGAYSDLRR